MTDLLAKAIDERVALQLEATRLREQIDVLRVRVARAESIIRIADAFFYNGKTGRALETVRDGRKTLDKDGPT